MKPSKYKTHQIQNLANTKPIKYEPSKYKTHQIQNQSNMKPSKYKTYQIHNEKNVTRQTKVLKVSSLIHCT